MSKIRSLVLAEFLKHFAKKKPDPYIWIFSSTDNRHYNYNSRYLFEYVKYLLLLIMIIMFLLYLMIVNLFIIRSRFDIVVIMSLLLYHFSNYILIIKIDNSFIIFSMLDFLLLFILIIFVN